MLNDISIPFKGFGKVNLPLSLPLNVVWQMGFQKGKLSSNLIAIGN